MSVLVTWAESGRIAAGDELSHNRILWTPAVDTPELKMDWFGNRPNGEAIGPFHLLAVPHLLRRGILDVGCTLRHRSSGERRPAASQADGAVPARAAEPPTPAAAPGTETAVLDVPQADANPQAAEPGARQPAAELEDALASALRRAEEETRVLGGQYAAFQKAAAAREQELALQLEKMREDAHTANLLLEAARVEIERLKEHGASLEKEDAASRKAARSAEALREECEHLRMQLRQRQDELENERTATAKRESQQKLAVRNLEDRQGELEEQVRAMRQEEAALHRQIEASEAGLEELRQRAQDAQRELQAAQERAQHEREAAAERERRLAEEGLAATRRSDTQAQLLKEAQATVEHLRQVLRRGEEELAGLRRQVVAAESSAPPTQWFLRGEGSPTIGPVTLSDIFEWATDCRVGPGHEVSLGGAEWRRACEVPELEMEWNVPLRDGTVIGPINVFAARSLLAEDAVAGDALLENCRTKETLRADTLRGPATEAALRIALLVHRKLARTEQKIRRQTEALLVARRIEPPPAKPAEPPKSVLSIFVPPATPLQEPSQEAPQPAGDGH